MVVGENAGLECVNCRVGSLESELLMSKHSQTVNCRVGSLENERRED